MPKRSVLQLLNYSVGEIRYKNIPLDDNHGRYHLHPRYERQLIDLGNNKYDFFISVEIVPDEGSPSPFELYVSLIGHFMLGTSDGESLGEEAKGNILRNNTTAILFPFLRSIVTSVTASANIPPLVLPILNFAEDTSNGNE